MPWIAENQVDPFSPDDQDSAASAEQAEYILEKVLAERLPDDDDTALLDALYRRTRRSTVGF